MLTGEEMSLEGEGVSRAEHTEGTGVLLKPFGIAEMGGAIFFF